MLYFEVGQLVDGDQKPKFHNLCMIAWYILTLSHGNADPESGFSISKNFLQLHGSSIKEKIIEALHMTNDYLIRIHGMEILMLTTS